mgnify:CR=1 FL=1
MKSHQQTKPRLNTHDTEAAIVMKILAACHSLKRASHIGECPERNEIFRIVDHLTTQLTVISSFKPEARASTPKDFSALIQGIDALSDNLQAIVDKHPILQISFPSTRHGLLKVIDSLNDFQHHFSAEQDSLSWSTAGSLFTKNEGRTVTEKQASSAIPLLK